MLTKPAPHLALKQYDQAIEWARDAIEITPNEDVPYLYLIVALALTGHESEAHEALQRYLSNPGAGRTMAAWKSRRSQYVDERTDPRYAEYWDRLMDGLRKAGLPAQ